MADDQPRTDASGSETLSQDAAAVATGSAVVLVGGLGERGLRLLLNWVLARALGPVGFGVYSFVQTTVLSLVSLSALGTDAGIVFFGARYRKAGERDRLKGTLLVCLGIGLASGLVFSLGVYLVGRFVQVPADKQAAVTALTLGASSVFFGTVLAVLVGGLVAARDMRGQAVVNQIGLPLLSLLATGLALALGTGLDGSLWAMALAYAASVGLGLRWFWRSFGRLLRDASVVPRLEPGALLRYSLPQSLARSLYQANLRLDVLMLTAMASLADVGVYKVATMIAQLGALPVMASTTMFGPVVSELVYSRELERLEGLLRVVTRWLIILSAPVYLLLLLVPDLVLQVFDPAFHRGGRALAILMAGQAMYVICAPSGAVVTMGGYSGTNLVNGLVAVALNIGLNAWFIPLWGMEGAALGAALAITLWSLLRVAQSWVLLRCWQFDRRSAAVLGVAVLAGGLAWLLSRDGGLALRTGAALGAVGVFLGVVALMGRTEEDEVVLGRIREKLGRLRGASR